MKIALIGTAPSSMHLAPYDDPSWTIYGCSPAAMGIKRFDAWFEIHGWPELLDPAIPVTYLPWLAALTVPVYMIEPDARVPPSVTYPHAEMVAEFGTRFWTSTISWMFAYALSRPGVEEIGLWGVDMSASEEYGYQRAGCHHFISVAEQRGIKLTVPPQSDLLEPPLQYGFGTTSRKYRKMFARTQELDARIAEAAANYEKSRGEASFFRGLASGIVATKEQLDATIAKHDADAEKHRNEWHFLKGARDDHEYHICTWMS